MNPNSKDSPPPPGPNGVVARRAAFGLLVAATVLVVGGESFSMLRLNGLNGLKVAILVTFLLLLVPIAFSFWTATLGFAAQLLGRRQGAPQPQPQGPLPRTAVIMPAYNEDPVRMFAGLRATYESLDQTGQLTAFDFFLLSDTTDPDVWVREEVAFAELSAAVRDPGRLRYRNRRQNTERKTGNIADFCATWGGAYRYMIVLDADSVMSGQCLVSLVRRMEEHPRVGILQAPPLPVNRQTLFGRLHQFATHAYGPTFMAGLNFWQGDAGNYWGHNAILRIRPFVHHCRLPTLPGRGPLAGSILSHDFVEAAFMRRAGWKVLLAGDLRGSYEEMPPSLEAYAVRDRRWCQGNLQHARMVLTPGLHLVSRLHLGLGVMSYLASPLWLLLLLLSTVEGLLEIPARHSYFPRGQSLFPTWKISVEFQALLLFGAVMAMLILPKLFSVIVHASRAGDSAGFGGRLKLALSVALETLFSTLLAPVLALLQSRFIVDILTGNKVRWNPQARGEAETSIGEAFRRHWMSSAVGLAWSVLLWYAAPQLLWWFAPVLAGLVLAAPMSAWTSRVSPGQWTRALGLFVTPEETAPPDILERLARELEAAQRRPWAAPRDGLGCVLEDGRVAGIHLRLLRPPGPADPFSRHHAAGLVLKLRLGGLSVLTSAEKRDLLLDRDSVRALLPAGPPARPSPGSERETSASFSNR